MIAIKGIDEKPIDCSSCFVSGAACPAVSYRNDRAPDGCPLVEIVTCKDCKHNTENTCDLDGYSVHDDYFCSSGEKKSEKDGCYIYLSGKDSNVVNGIPRSEEYFEERITGNPDFCNG